VQQQLGRQVAEQAVAFPAQPILGMVVVVHLKAEVLHVQAVQVLLFYDIVIFLRHNMYLLLQQKQELLKAQM
jgi:hypothetical protein